MPSSNFRRGLSLSTEHRSYGIQAYSAIHVVCAYMFNPLQTQLTCIYPRRDLSSPTEHCSCGTQAYSVIHIVCVCMFNPLPTQLTCIYPRSSHSARPYFYLGPKSLMCNIASKSFTRDQGLIIFRTSSQIITLNYKLYIYIYIYILLLLLLLKMKYYGSRSIEATNGVAVML